jgi:WD40 repeat protein
MGEKKQKHFPVWLFAMVFIIGALLPFINRMLSPAKASLSIRDSSGSSALLSFGSTLVAVFQDGKVAAWDWENPSLTPLWQFPAGSDRLVILDDNHIAAVTKTDRKQLVTYELKTGKKISEIPVGWEDQDVWLVQSPDRKVLVLACINPDKDGHTLYEFMLFDLAKGKPELPVSVDVVTAEKRCIAFAISNDKKILAAGSMDKHGWLTVADLTKGKVLLKKEYEQADEFTSVAFAPDGSKAFLTNRNGSVYGIDTVSGEIKSTYNILKPGEKNPVTNDSSSQNVIISTNGQFIAAVMLERKVAIWNVETGSPVFQIEPGHKLTGPIALSPEGSLLATSDKRSSGVVRIWQIKK